ncbi:MAG: PIN domain-containing protein [Armatimonadetes bacterium]|nr:PIN domain-containing protein [Armatimonadota bacterium]
MRFWDASALVPLCLDQPASATARALLREDPAMVAWWGSVLECWSAFARLRRDGVLLVDEEERARTLLRALQDAWTEIQPGEEVRGHAARLLRMHPLRSLDALQLAAALVWAGSPPAGEIVVFDGRLEDAARLEGLTPRP